MMMCGVLRALSKAQGRWDMMAGHRQFAAKHQINAYLIVKVWTYGIDGSLQSSLPMPRRSSHAHAPWLKLAVRELPLTLFIAEGGRTHRDHPRSDQPRRDSPMSKEQGDSYAGARHGQGSTPARPRHRERHPRWTSPCTPRQDLLRP